MRRNNTCTFDDSYRLCGKKKTKIKTNLYSMSSSTMAGTHVPVALSNGSGNTHIPVLPVHVMCSRTRVIPQPNAEVLDLNWGLFGDLFQVDNLTGGLLKLLELPQEIPETGFRHDPVGGEYPHFVERSHALLLRRQLAPDNFILLQL